MSEKEEEKKTGMIISGTICDISPFTKKNDPGKRFAGLFVLPLGSSFPVQIETDNPDQFKVGEAFKAFCRVVRGFGGVAKFVVA